MTPAAYAVLDLSALRHNLKRVRQCAPNSKVMAVIKANAYGHGLIRIANALNDADGFAVARVDEGVSLRQHGIEQRITVLEGYLTAEELRLQHRFRLEPVLHTREQLDILESAELPNGDGSLAVWLKLDTGMHRLGFDVSEFKSIYERINHCKAISKPVPLMMHLANADDLTDTKTKRQITLFERTTAEFEGERSIANSAGILSWKQSHSDWVRPGIMLFGVSPFPDRVGENDGLKPVMSFYSRLLAVKRLKTGDEVGYGSSWACPRDMMIGLVAVGYGDGFPRHAITGTPVMVKGHRVPLVGRVSMDIITVDLSIYSDARVGDPVMLWGPELAVEEIARHSSTIPYTLLCAITQRVMIL